MSMLAMCYIIVVTQRSSDDRFLGWPLWGAAEQNMGLAYLWLQAPLVVLVGGIRVGYLWPGAETRRWLFYVSGILLKTTLTIWSNYTCLVDFLHYRDVAMIQCVNATEASEECDHLYILFFMNRIMWSFAIMTFILNAISLFFAALYRTDAYMPVIYR